MNPGPFAPAGFDDSWMGNIRHWQDWINDQDGARTTVVLDRSMANGDFRALIKEAQGLWQHLALTVKLCELGGTLPMGRTPRTLDALLLSLPQIALLVEAPDVSRALSARGFGPDQQDRLRGVLAELSASRDAAVMKRRDHGATSAALSVARGAIYGDLVQLCKVAQRSIVPSVRERLQVQRLFPGRGRRLVDPPAQGATDPPAQGADPQLKGHTEVASGY